MWHVTFDTWHVTCDMWNWNWDKRATLSFTLSLVYEFRIVWWIQHLFGTASMPEKRVQSSKYGVQSTEYRVQSTEYIVQSAWYRVQGTELGSQGRWLPEWWYIVSHMTVNVSGAIEYHWERLLNLGGTGGVFSGKVDTHIGAQCCVASVVGASPPPSPPV